MAIPFTRGKEEAQVVLPALGEQGDACRTCGAGLATDQRYCLNCGTRRAGPRLEFEKALFSAPEPAMAAAGGPVGPAGARGGDWTPMTAVASIAVLGGMLLLGVLIGRDDDGSTQVTAAAPTTPVAAAPTTPEAAAPAATAAAPPAPAPGTGDVVKGGSGTTEGVASADLEAVEQAAKQGGKAQQEASKNIPDQVATKGPSVKQDPGGKPGGNDGSPSACIGC